MLILFMIIVLFGLFVFTMILGAIVKLVVKLFDKVIFPIWMIRILVWDWRNSK